MKIRITKLKSSVLAISLFSFTFAIASFAEEAKKDYTRLPEPKIIAREGKGFLARVDGKLLLYVEGSPYEMGRQHGKLLREHVRRNLYNIIYGVGTAYSLKTGDWFLDTIQTAYDHMKPHIDKKYFEEFQGLADGAGLDVEEVVVANIFPAMFHCSGFALFGDATVGGKLYHGRILDYSLGVGLDKHAVVIVQKPDKGNAFVNVSFAGFIGSVTGMNEKQIAVGEMGGAGEGWWDGVPMPLLVRKALEEADTLDEAVGVFKKNPRTCEYYYVVSDGKIPDARGLACTPEKVDVIKPGEFHPRLPTPVKDCVLLSAKDRYVTLVKRVKEHYGKIDLAQAIDLMLRPVAMKSNLHDVLFAPQSYDLWVAIAKRYEPACFQPYVHYNLKAVLDLAQKLNAEKTSQPKKMEKKAKKTKEKAGAGGKQ